MVLGNVLSLAQKSKIEAFYECGHSLHKIAKKLADAEKRLPVFF